MNNIDILTSIGLISTFISLLLAFFIASVGSKNKVSNYLFAVFLILNAFEFSGWFSSLIFKEPDNFLILKEQLSHVTIPVFYLYILSVCFSDFRLQRKHLWHLTPFVIANIVMIPRFYLSTTEEKITLFNSPNILSETIFTHISLHIQSIVYLTLCFFVLKRAKKIFLENYSSNTLETYNWLFRLLLFMAALYGVAIVKNGLKFFGEVDSFKSAQIILSIVILCFVCWYVLQALKYPDIFRGVDSSIKPTKDLQENVKVDANKNSAIEELKKHMSLEKPYLNPSLTIRNLAQEINMNSRDLSVLINQNLGQHFFDFVNEYRIEEAKSILKNPDKKEFTVLEILYEVGFNSKSSFNTAFKKHTGVTPTQYRKTA